MEVYLWRRHRQPEWEVQTGTDIMNVLARVQMGWWMAQLGRLGLSQARAKGVVKKSMRTCIIMMAAHKLHNVRRSREERLRCRHRDTPGEPEGAAAELPRTGIG